MHSRSLWFVVALAGFLLAVPGARAALAETVRLRSGRALKVDEVRVGERVISVTIRKDGGTARMDLPFERLEPRGLLTLLDRHGDPREASAQLRSARLALEFGLRGEAALRFHQAAATDPALCAERDAGLAVLRALEAADALVDLETRLRAGDDPRGALTLAAALLDGPDRAALTSVQVLRIKALAGLARGLLDRAKRAAAAAAAPAAPVEPGAAAPAAPSPVPADLAARLDAEEAKARHAREAAADPSSSARHAIRHLETAARALLQGRRLLRATPAAVQVAAESASLTLRGLLVATYLDLADLYRQERRFAEARARVRAVLILDPGNEEAWAQRQLIEDDLYRDLREEGEEPYRSLFYDPYLYSDHGLGLGFRSAYPRYYRRSYGVVRFGHFGGLLGLGTHTRTYHTHHRARRGPRRAVGSRRSR